MDKRKEANLRVKKNITEALFALMDKKDFSNITVTDIIEEAKVARASFYRNYESKEDILVTFVIEIFHDFNNEAAYDLTEYYSYRNVCHIFTYLKTYRKYILALCHVGLGASLLEALNRFVEENAGVMPCTSIRKYRLYIFSGALVNAGLIWLKNNCPESIEAISAEFCNCLGIPLVRTC